MRFEIKGCKVVEGKVYHETCGLLGEARHSDDEQSIIQCWEECRAKFPTDFSTPMYLIRAGDHLPKNASVVLQERLNNMDASYLGLAAPSYHATVNGQEGYILQIRDLKY